MAKKRKVGDQWTEIKKVKGKKRKLTFEKTAPRGRNKNLDRKIVSNKSA
ncbi:MAG: hypothetical protein U9Q73_01905 [Nanoarchaeota archaeon]|nr:hypothetical protein [Nanoarchaeota archaeon]